jgi:phosphoribosylanthranilate isomerase
MTILDEIVEYKRELLANGYYDKKLEELKEVDVSSKPTFKESMDNSEELVVISEIKSKSPSLPELPPKDLEQQVRDYEANGANAVSILTDEKYFGGSYERLQSLTTQTNLPVLCKDFVVDPIQIDVAKKAGASIILLIVNVLTSKRFVTVEEIRHLTENIPNDKEIVVIVVNPTIEQINDLVAETALTAIQLHGMESLDLIKEIRTLHPQLKIIKALPAQDENILLEQLALYNDDIDLFIIDTPSENYGGTGKHFNWEKLRNIKGYNFLIAGGINYDNINKINELALNHSGYDIASGIETNGRKDLTKMQDIIELVKEGDNDE